MRPLDGVLVLDLSQFLSGPSATLRLLDLGARVIKIEKPGKGDICRELYISDVILDGDSTPFHAINRGKESIALDLKVDSDVRKLHKLIGRSDVFVHNFRPGVMERLGLDVKTLQSLYPTLIYASISGYGEEGPWRDKPGQDLLLQALSGLTWLSGSKHMGPVPMGLSICDMLAGAQLAQGILSALFRKSRTGKGGLVEVSMLEAILDFQLEVLTTYFQDGQKPPQRTVSHGAHAYLGAPYGIYRSKDGWVALAMADVTTLADVLRYDALRGFGDPHTWFDQREVINNLLAERILTDTTSHWLDLLQNANVWCAPVLSWDQLTVHPAYEALRIQQTTRRDNGTRVFTTAIPIRFNGERFCNHRGAPKVGEHTDSLVAEFGL